MSQIPWQSASRGEALEGNEGGGGQSCILLISTVEQGHGIVSRQQR